MNNFIFKLSLSFLLICNMVYCSDDFDKTDTFLPSYQSSYIEESPPSGFEASKLSSFASCNDITFEQSSKKSYNKLRFTHKIFTSPTPPIESNRYFSRDSCISVYGAAVHCKDYYETESYNALYLEDIEKYFLENNNDNDGKGSSQNHIVVSIYAACMINDIEYSIFQSPFFIKDKEIFIDINKKTLDQILA